MSTYQDIKNEVALRAIDACGNKGILKWQIYFFLLETVLI